MTDHKSYYGVRRKNSGSPWSGIYDTLRTARQRRSALGKAHWEVVTISMETLESAEPETAPTVAPVPPK